MFAGIAFRSSSGQFENIREQTRLDGLHCFAVRRGDGVRVDAERRRNARMAVGYVGCGGPMPSCGALWLTRCPDNQFHGAPTIIASLDDSGADSGSLLRRDIVGVNVLCDRHAFAGQCRFCSYSAADWITLASAATVSPSSITW